MDELKVLLDGRDIEYSETELVINEDGVPDGPPNSTIENLNSVFVSLITEGLRARVAEWSNPPILNLYINSFKLRLDHSGSQPFN